MMIGISYFIVHLLAMALPGWFIMRLFGFGSGRPVFVLAGSYIYFALLASLSKWLHLPLNVFLTIYALLFFLIAGLSFRVHPDPGFRGARCPTSYVGADQWSRCARF